MALQLSILPPIPLTRWHILLGSAAMGLAALCLWQGLTDAAMPDFPPAVPAAVSATAALQPSARLPPLAELSAAAERPLFNPTRRRVLPPPVTAAPPAASNRAFRLPQLLGVAGVGDRRLALIKVPDERDVRRLRVGDSYDGWAVGDIRGNSVVFRNGTEEREVTLTPVRETAGGGQGPRR
jgi:hypothetical protein